MKRRDFIKNTAAAGIILSATSGFGNILEDIEVPIRAITKGPNFHWFGYYDKLEFDPTGRYVLGMEVNFQGRTATQNDKVKIGMIDLQKGDQWIELGESKVFSWQQGCMLQFIPGSSTEVIWNDREGDKFVSRVFDIKTKKMRTLPMPIYSISPDGKWAIVPDFSRLDNMRPGYGYAGVPDKFNNQKFPDESGIFRMDMKTGETKLIIPFSRMAKIPNKGENLEDYWHWFNHLLFNTDGSRFLFLHRWRKTYPEKRSDRIGGFITRMWTCDINGDDAYIVDPSGNTSHFIWRDPKTICVWTKPDGMKDGFYVFEDKTDKVYQVGEGVMTENGHNTYLPLPGSNWILNDTYPYFDKERRQKLYLYHVPTNKEYVLGRFHEPPEYAGEFRCDLHPRSNRQGTAIVFDSTHGGNGRQMYIADISKFIKSKK